MINIPYITMTNFGRNGRLGNQMFQFGALLEAARLLKRRLILPPESNETSGFYRLFPGVRVFCEPVDSSYLISRCSYPTTTLDYGEGASYERIIDDLHHVDENTSNVNLLGYFQDERFFLPNKHDLLGRWFKQECETEQYMQARYGRGDGEIRVGVHLRFGDYNMVRPSFFANVTHAYYMNALSQILDYYSQSNYDHFGVYVISDDPHQAHQFIGESFKHVHGINRTYFVGGIQPSNEVEDFVLLRSMDHHVICNSTFSWWAAYLSTNRRPECDKLVVIPNRWFGPANAKHDASGLYVKSWIKVPNE